MAERYRKAAIWQAVLSTLGTVIDKSRGRRSGAREPSASLDVLEPRMLMSTYFVTSTADDGSSGTLRWAISQTNSDGGGTVDLSAVAGSNIDLSLGQLEINSPSNTYVAGNNVTINGDGGTRVLQVDSGATATLANLTITGGEAYNGGGIYNLGTVTLTGASIQSNQATNEGGGIFNRGGTANITGSTLDNNTASNQGGAIFNYYSGLTATSTIFENDSSGFGGGAIANQSPEGPSSNATITNCRFDGNQVTVSGDGGAILNGNYSYAVVSNSTFTSNSAPAGGAIADDFGSTGTSFIQVNNSILWSDGGGELEASFGGDSPGGGIGVAYSDVDGGIPSSPLISDGGGNINLDPQFSGFQLQLTSPCVNAGNNGLITSGVTTDLAGNPRIVDSVVDMGAYEFQQLGPIYVDLSATGLNDGFTWGNAFTSLQSGLNEAASLESANPGASLEILVAQGTYYPNAPSGRVATFQLQDNVSIFGGYAGDTSSDPYQNNPSAFVTDLSGDIGTLGVSSDNAYHVVTGSGTDSSAVLDGFTIENGNANGSGSGQSNGGGVYIASGSPTINRCVITLNAANSSGGGLYLTGSSPSLSNDTISSNGARLGGGMYDNSSTPNLNNDTLSGNSAIQGGGMYNYLSSPTLTGLTFDHNMASTNGGGIYNLSSSPSVSSDTLSNNTVTAGYGGGIDNEGFSTPDINNDTISGNTATYGGGIANVGSPVTIEDCTFNNDTATVRGGGIYNLDSSPTVTGSNFGDGSTGNADRAVDGGAICDDSTCTLVVTDCDFNGDTASQNGGAIESYGCSGTVTISGGEFTGNTAGNEGGAVYARYSTVTITGVIFDGDSAAHGGGAIANQGVNTSSLYNTNETITNCDFVGNKVTVYGDGGAILNGYYSFVTIDNSTFTANSAPAGGAIAEDFGSQGTSFVHLDNSILWNDSATAPNTNELESQFWGDYGPGITVEFTDVDGGVPVSELISNGTGNTNADPLFITNPDVGSGNFGNEQLQDPSPSINRGSNADVPSGVTTDLAGHTRIFANIVDQGAYENQDTTAVYVDHAATGADDGSSWNNAFVNLQDALSFVQGQLESGDTGASDYFIYVGQGTYLPSEGGSGGTSVGTVEQASNIPGNMLQTSANAGGGNNLNAAVDVTINPDLSVTVTSTGWGTYDGADDTAVDVINHSSQSISSLALSSASDIFGFDGDGVSTYINEPTGASGYEGPDNFFSNINVSGSVETGVVHFTDTDCGLAPGASTYFSLESDLSSGLPTVAINQPVTFQLVNNVSILGGFAGTGATDPYARNVSLYPTILSGNVDPDHDGCVSCYHVVTGSGTDNTAALDGVTITQGNANGTGTNQNIGAGLFDDNGSPIINDVTFTGNNATNGAGAANINGSAPRLTNDTFTNNVATSQGSGVYNNASTPVLTNDTFTTNTAASGAGLANVSGSSPVVFQSSFTSNTATSQGGGIYDSASSPTLMNDTFTTNHAFSGGGIADVSSSAPNVTLTSFTSNTASSQGGGIYNNHSSPTISNDSFLTNHAVYGGGIADISTSAPTISTVTFSSNVATSEGGGVYNSSSSPTLSGNDMFNGNVANFQGGGIYDTSSSPSLNSVFFNSNTGAFGGGGMYNLSSSPTLTSVTFSGNTANSGGGGGMYNNSGTIHLTSCTFSGNTANSSYGGAIYNLNATVTLTSTNLSSNHASNGGGMADVNSNVTATNSQFNSNTASNNGGAIYNSVSSLTVTGCTLNGDSAVDGGAIFNNDAVYIPGYSCGGYSCGGCGGTTYYSGHWAPSGQQLTVQNGSFTGDSATYQGGAIYNTYTSAVITDGTFDGDTAHNGGGAIASGSSATTSVTNSAFVGNKVTVSGDGSALLTGGAYSYTTVDNSTFTNNSDLPGGSSGGAVFDSGVCEGATYVHNSVLWNDTSGEIGVSNAGVVTADYSDIQGGYGGTANINADPKFVRNPNLGISDYGNLQLQNTSPAINQGNNSDIPGGITTDLAGNARIVGGVVDMGAYENQVTTVYVDHLAPGPTHNGSSWTNAYLTLQDALTALGSPSSAVRIEVGQGTYTPTSGTTRTSTYQIANNELIFGSYAGYGTSNPNARSTTSFPTNLSGDIGTVGNTSDNVYHVVTVSGTNSSAWLDGFTIKLGNANGTSSGQNQGGGIYDLNGGLTVNSCTITANSSSSQGGGIYISTASPTLSNDTISNNSTSGNGGGLYDNSATPTFTSSTFSGNSASSGQGGGIYNSHSSMTLTSVAFTSNTARNGGGAIYNYNVSSPTLTSCTFNSNTSTFGGGGGIYDYASSSPTLTNCTFTSNSTSSGNGGGMYNYSSSPHLTGGAFNSNTAVNGGGGMYNYSSSPVLTSVSFTGNSANSGGGGGMYNIFGSPHLTSCTFISNLATSSYGGGIYSYQSNLTVTSGTFTGNHAALGGAMAEIHSTITLTNSTFTSNVASSEGGAIFNQDSTLTVTGCTFNGDSAVNGGAIFDADTVYSCGGGGYSCGGPYYAVGHISNSSFGGDTATGSGGAIDNSDTSLTVTNCTFDGDSAANGGAIFNNDSVYVPSSCSGGYSCGGGSGGSYTAGYWTPTGQELTVQSCTFAGDTATTDGGAIYNTYTTAVITGSNFDGDSAHSGGGAIFSQTQTTETITNSDFVGNKVTLSSADGGAVFGGSSSSTTVSDSTFTANSVVTSGHGGAIFSNSSPFQVNNSILWGDTGGEIAGSSMTVRYSDVQGGFSGTGNINSDPKFVRNASVGSGDYGDEELQSTSPAINTGNNGWVPGGTPKDLAGNTRIVHTTVDMGAFENQFSTLPTVSTFTIGHSGSQISSITIVLNQVATMTALTLYSAGGVSMPYQLTTSDHKTYVLTFPVSLSSSYVGNKLPAGTYSLVLEPQTGSQEYYVFT